MKLIKIRNIALVLLLMILAFFGGYLRGAERSKDVSLVEIRDGQLRRFEEMANKKVDFDLFWDVWERLETNYLDAEDIDATQMLYGAIQGMTASLGDPYTAFLPPTDNERSKEDLNGEFNGVGIQLGFIDQTLAVMSPLPDNPAIKAGVKPRDLILRIRDKQKGIDEETSGMSLVKAVNLIRGKKGTSVTLTLLSNGAKETRDVDIVRDVIFVPSVKLEWMKNDSVAHLRVMRFGSKTLTEWQEAVRQIAGKRLIDGENFKGVVLDLRNNPGGFLQQAVNLASEFMEEGVVVQQEDKKGVKTFSVTRTGQLINAPIVVLVNRGSASASEILAGALREQVGAKLVGEKTFGKGTVQEAQELDKGAGLHVTIARWLLPSGKNIHGEGLDPDVEVVYAAKENNLEIDNQLERAIEELLKI